MRRTDEKFKYKFNKRDSNQNCSSAPYANYQKGSGSLVKPTSTTCGKRHFGNCLAGTSGCLGCGKDDHKVTDCPKIAPRRREAKKVPPNVPDGGSPNRNIFYDLRAKGNKSDDDNDVSKL